MLDGSRWYCGWVNTRELSSPWVQKTKPMNPVMEYSPSSQPTNTVGLTACIECGFMISRSARRCVNCGTSAPAGVTCHLCEERMSKKEAVTEGTQGRYFHRACLTAHFAIPASVRCPDCGRSLEALSPLWKIPHSCPYCGADTPLSQNGQRPIYRCTGCTLPIFTAFQAWRSGSGENAHYCTSASLQSHEFCAKETTSWRSEWSKFLQKCFTVWVCWIGDRIRNQGPLRDKLCNPTLFLRRP
jgi:hypothetical protein